MFHLSASSHVSVKISFFSQSVSKSGLISQGPKGRPGACQAGFKSWLPHPLGSHWVGNQLTSWGISVLARKSEAGRIIPTGRETKVKLSQKSVVSTEEGLNCVSYE